MPELPEVETTRRGIEPHILKQDIRDVIVRQSQLRWPVPGNLAELLRGSVIQSVGRRAKYLLVRTASGTLIIHLGMSGSLRLVSTDVAVGAHDHIDICLSSGKVLRYTDPRRFGAFLWSMQDPMEHKLLRDLGPEPLAEEFNGDLLYRLSRGRSASVKQFIMDGHIVVGVGNIYANEALYMAGIHPKRAAKRVSLARYRQLASAIKTVLGDAIAQGGTTLRDFVGGDGKPGYFKQKLNVYGRGGESCNQCGSCLSEIRQGQRSTVYCRHCQR